MWGIYKPAITVTAAITPYTVITMTNFLCIGSLLLVLAVHSLSAVPFRKEGPVSDKPSFCHDDDCPKFTVLKTESDYELRKYEPSKWVGTTVPSMNWTAALNEGYSRLYKYRNGENQEKKQIPMATPVATKIVPGQGPACESNFTILFFVPFAYQDNTPTPTDPRIAFVNLPSVNAYVSSFSGEETELRLQESASNLIVTLQDAKIDIVSDYYFTAEYDGPERKTGRHNEVWFLAA